MPALIKLVVAATAGGVLAAGGFAGLVVSQTQTPDKNPASQTLFSYGDN